MKKTVIGASLLASGTILFTGIVISGAINFQWSLWSSIKRLSLALPFILSIVLNIIGLTILMLELYNKDLKTFTDDVNKKFKNW